MRDKKSGVVIQPYSVKDFARIYNVSRKTFRRWVVPFQGALGDRNGHYYNVCQVKTIFEKLGLPEQVEEN
jgi:hypothetical protein